MVDSIPEEIEHMINVNVLGVYYMTQSVLPAMIEIESGDIVKLAGGDVRKPGILERGSTGHVHDR